MANKWEEFFKDLVDETGKLVKIGMSAFSAATGQAEKDN